MSVSSNGSQHKGQSLSTATSSSSFEPHGVAASAGMVCGFRAVSVRIEEPRRFGTLNDDSANKDEDNDVESVPLLPSSNAADDTTFERDTDEDGGVGCCAVVDVEGADCDFLPGEDPEVEDEEVAVVRSAVSFREAD